MEKQAFIDKGLAEALKKIEEEVGGLLGQDFDCSAHKGQHIEASQALAAFTEKGIVVEMAVSGSSEAKAFILLGLRDAIELGGTLILLPEEELEERCQRLEFDEELADSYGEIANIIAGVYTAVFSERGTIKLHFKKTALEPFEAQSSHVVPAGSYYSSTTSLKLDGTAMGQMQVLFPCQVFGLEPPQPAAPTEPAPDSAAASPQAPEAAEEGWDEFEASASAPSPPEGDVLEPTAASPQEGLSPLQAAAQAAAAKLGTNQTSSPPAPAAQDGHSPLILVVSEDRETALAFAQPFNEQSGDEVVCLNYQDSLREAVAARKVRGVFLVMKEVGERGFASVIKIQSTLDPPPPLVVAGPQWTRSTVLKAVKYGACDVLITPVEDNELLDKLQCHMGA